MSNIRKTIPPHQTIEKHSTGLDARSAVALEFIAFWCHRHTNLKPAPAVVIRRALVLLADHLSNLDEDLELRAECRAFEDAGKGKGSPRSLTEARARIEDHIEAPARQPMTHWHDALHSKEERAETRRMLDALELVMQGVE